MGRTHTRSRSRDGGSRRRDRDRDRERHGSGRSGGRSGRSGGATASGGGRDSRHSGSRRRRSDEERRDGGRRRRDEERRDEDRRRSRKRRASPRPRLSLSGGGGPDAPPRAGSRSREGDRSRKRRREEEAAVDDRRRRRREAEKAAERDEDGDVRDDSAGHYEGVNGDVVGGRYEIVGEAGMGTFGRVVECCDLKKGRSRVALKIVRRIERYTESAAVEAEVLRDVNRAAEASGRRGGTLCVKLLETFEHRGHFCLAFEKAGTCVESQPIQDTFNVSVPERIFGGSLSRRREVGERIRTVQESWETSSI